VADRPLRPATRHRHGGPLPRHPADRPQAPPSTDRSFACSPDQRPSSCGITRGFPRLSPAPGWVPHVFLTRPPRSTPERVPVRLACIRHAASVVPEPGSNSPSRLPTSVGGLSGLCNSIVTSSPMANRPDRNCGSLFTLYELRFSCQGAGGETKPARMAGGNTSSRLRVSAK
jgi:hypothetical protein